MNDSQIITVLRAYADYLHVTNFVSDGLRWIGYMIIYGLTTVVNALSGIFASMYKLLDFWGYAPLQNFLKTYDPVIWALATIGLIWAGLMMMHNKRVDYHEKGNNFLVALLLFFGLTFVMTQGTKLITAGAEQAMVNTPSAVSIYQGNITDVYMLDKAGWKTSGGKAKLPMTTNQIKNMEDITWIIHRISKKQRNPMIHTGLRCFGVSPIGCAYMLRLSRQKPSRKRGFTPSQL